MRSIAFLTRLVTLIAGRLVVLTVAFWVGSALAGLSLSLELVGAQFDQDDVRFIARTADDAESTTALQRLILAVTIPVTTRATTQVRRS